MDKCKPRKIEYLVFYEKLNNKNWKKIEYYVRLKFFVLSKKAISIFVCFILCLLGVILYFSSSKQTFQPVANVIVIDAGHGGQDGGAVGRTGVTESFLNLQYAKELKKLCQNAGFNVVMTRIDMSGLYSPLAQNKKKSEMEKRKSIIDSSDARCVVSLHMNSFPSSSTRGAQVFYRAGSESGKAFATCVQNKLTNEIDFSKKECSAGDYFVLNCTDKPAILVECGFLSNQEEETLLCDEAYRSKFCNALLKGIINFFEM